MCVFGGALLESCTGGLMYSHELQTCDWPRNVGCEVAEVSAPSAPAREVTPRVPAVTKFRFSSVPEQQQPARETQREREREREQSQPSAPAHIQQIQTIPPPPELKYAPNPVITSRGQPRNFEKDEIIKVGGDFLLENWTKTKLKFSLKF